MIGRTVRPSTDWYRWHDRYDDDSSRLRARLERTQAAVRRFLDEAPPGPLVVLDVCGGTGRCVLPVLATHDRRPDVVYQLVEIDERCVDDARAATARADIDLVARNADAGLADTYLGLARADLLLMSGMFIHMSRRDRRTALQHAREVCNPGARLVWTIRDGAEAERIRRYAARAGFVDRSVAHPVDRFRVGEAAMTGAPATLVPGERWFRFRGLRPQSRRNRARVAFGRWRRIVLRQPPVDPGHSDRVT